jgi:uncharacterized membrane protein
MRVLLAIASIGNLVDAAATAYLTRLGYLEANPVMRWLLQTPGVFIFVKFFTMTAVLLWLWHKREDRHARPLATIAAAVYGLIALYYILWGMIH